MAVYALEETLSDISSRLDFEIQLKPEQKKKSIISLLIRKKFGLSIIHYRQIKDCYMPARAGIEYFL